MKTQNKKRKIGDVWKEEPQWDNQGKWKVQYPKGILTFKTKKLAKSISTLLKGGEV